MIYGFQAMIFYGLYPRAALVDSPHFFIDQPHIALVLLQWLLKLQH